MSGFVGKIYHVLATVRTVQDLLATLGIREPLSAGIGEIRDLLSTFRFSSFALGSFWDLSVDFRESTK